MGKGSALSRFVQGPLRGSDAARADDRAGPRMEPAPASRPAGPAQPEDLPVAAAPREASAAPTQPQREVVRIEVAPPALRPELVRTAPPIAERLALRPLE